jgi:hypothetical protein
MRRIRRETSGFVYGRSRRKGLQCLLHVCIEQLVATSDVAETRQVDVVCALGVVRTGNSPAIGNTEADVISRIVARVDDRRVGRLRSKVLESTLVWTGRLAVDLDHITTEEGRDPIIWPRGELNTTGDADVGASVVDGELASGNRLAIVAADLGPLEDVVTVGDPGRDFHVLALAAMCVTRVEAIAVAVPGVALALNDVLIAEEVLLFLRVDIVLHLLD